MQLFFFHRIFPQTYSKSAILKDGQRFFMCFFVYTVSAFPESDQVTLDQRKFLLMISPIEKRTKYLKDK